MAEPSKQEKKGAREGDRRSRPGRGSVRGSRQGYISHCCKREPRDRGNYPHRSGSPVMRPITLPSSECDSGKAPKSLIHQWSAESKHTPPVLRVARPRFLGDGVLAQREYGGVIDRSIERWLYGYRRPGVTG